MAEVLTAQQRLAVENRGGKLLVSAAAGSGKTKVLVDRLISYLTDPGNPANIDEFLIITYTKAAASELRAKIAAKLSEKIAAEPQNRHLQRQMQRLYLTKISTIHSFCSDMIRQYAYMLDISADFRVADEEECLELQINVLEKLLEEAYASADSSPAFCAFIDSQGFGRDDRQVPEIILKVYNSARCHLNPGAWLDWCVDAISAQDTTEPAETVWGKYLVEDLHEYIQMQIESLKSCCDKALQNENMEKPAALLQSTISQLEELKGANCWDDIARKKRIDYGRLVFSKKCSDLQLVEEIKAVRKRCKEGLDRKLTTFSGNSEQVMADLRASGTAALGLVELVRKFESLYTARKRLRRVLDFSDLEHKMLDLVLGKGRGSVTGAAKEIGACYREIMIDEYQDTNEVQDRIFSALTFSRQNCFMVGDVKQSIYQFRLADPEIFIEKYDSYLPAVNAPDGEGRKVILSHNFRSASGVIHAVNDVFECCMSKEVGGVDYTETEFLHEGIPHVKLDEPEIELYGIAVKEDTYSEEAAFTANRIAELLDGKHMIRSGDLLRPIEPEDVVILLRSPGSVGNEFRFALEQRGIPCTTGNGTDLLQTEEVSVLRSLLQVISNPVQDIPLIAVLASRLFCFSADELADIRADSKYSTFYEAVINSQKRKCQDFLQLLTDLRQDARLYGLSQLMHQIFVRTRIDSIYAAMPDGKFRKENLQTFCQIASDFETGAYRDLDQFLDHLSALETRGLRNAAQQSNTGCVTIMSIHKSKGLEFPVVFLCGLSRSFNRENTRAPVLCDKNLGLGLSCVDIKNRVRYPSIAKRAISQKIVSDSISEEMRVLYVAMTRPKDRLIMTYAVKNLEADLNDIVLRYPHTQKKLLTGEVNSPGEWVLQTALTKTEAGAFFTFAGSSCECRVSDVPWKIAVVTHNVDELAAVQEVEVNETISEETVDRIAKALNFSYPYANAVNTPSKLTATQLKGRMKDVEAAEDTDQAKLRSGIFRKPNFIGTTSSGKDVGNAMHAVMQHISYQACVNEVGVKEEIERIVQMRLITRQQADLVNVLKIVKLFTSDLGIRIRNSQNVLREFKFSILDSSEKYSDAYGEDVLLQGVVDCALIDEDGITIIDFKTDFVTDATIGQKCELYTPQVKAYAGALERIYQCPVKEVFLYFFHTDSCIPISI